jgi:hypothetical protein
MLSTQLLDLCSDWWRIVAKVPHCNKPQLRLAAEQCTFF